VYTEALPVPDRERLRRVYRSAMSWTPPPPGTTGGPTDPLWQPTPPRHRSKVPLVIGAVLVVVALGVVAVVVMRSGGSDSIDTELAVSGLEELGERADEDFDETFGLTDSCPIVDLADVVEAVNDRIGTDFDERSDESAIAVGGRDTTIACFLGDILEVGDDDAFTLAASLDPRGREFRAVRGRADGDIDDGTDRSHRGGVLQSFCVDPDDSETDPSCTAGWSGEGLLVAIAIPGSRIDQDEAVDALVAILDLVIGGLEDAA
jgi:hypothetical protein